MRITQATIFASLLLSSLVAHAGQPIINLNVGGQLAPGVYGEVQFGNAPPPPVVYAQPRVVVRDPRYQEMEPLYLAVPPGHARNWRKHCRDYDACGRRVYFVRSEEYEPGYREDRGHDRDRHEHRYEGDRRGEQEDHGDRGNDGRGNEEHDRGRHRGRDD